MDIENLNKSQIIMLTLLVSFMTSIATGIVTVSLMDQAPPAITQTVNKVIERTVEKVVPDQTAAAAVPKTIEKTIYVKESESVADAVGLASPSVVRLMSNDELSPVFLSLGIVVDKSGIIVADSAGLGEHADALIGMPGGKTVRVFVTSRDATSGLAYLSAPTSTPVAWKAATFAENHPTLGKTVIVIAGKSVNRINTGVITAFTSLEDAETGQIVETNIPKDDIMPGSPIIDIEGNVLGVSTGMSRRSSEKGFVTVSPLEVGSSKESKAQTQ